MRHGQKESGGNSDLARLTKNGRLQVMSSAANNIKHIGFDALYASCKFRTLETVVSAVSVLPNRNNKLSINTDIGFDYTGAPGLDQFKQASEEVSLLALGKPVTVAMWMAVAPEMIGFLRERFTRTLLATAHYHHAGAIGRKETKGMLNILVASHSPVGELACLDPETTPMLREADIMRYTIDVLPRETKIVEVQYIPRGF
ncbi:MAG: hypothetical protein AAB547_01690 [Patescibacteria group bacterium]